jgi:hypothetical protein
MDIIAEVALWMHEVAEPLFSVETHLSLGICPHSD